MNYTTPEQSKRLLELGLDPNTADMNHYEKDDGWVTLPRGQISYGGFKIIPCWSSDRLLDLMPTIKKNSNEYVLYLIKEPTKTLKGKDITFWYCSYALLDDSNEELIVFSNESKIETTYSMMVWLLENRYL